MQFLCFLRHATASHVYLYRHICYETRPCLGEPVAGSRRPWCGRPACTRATSSNQRKCRPARLLAKPASAPHSLYSASAHGFLAHLAASFTIVAPTVSAIAALQLKTLALYARSPFAGTMIELKILNAAAFATPSQRCTPARQYTGTTL